MTVIEHLSKPLLTSLFTWSCHVASRIALVLIAVCNSSFVSTVPSVLHETGVSHFAQDSSPLDPRSLPSIHVCSAVRTASVPTAWMTVASQLPIAKSLTRLLNASESLVLILMWSLVSTAVLASAPRDAPTIHASWRREVSSGTSLEQPGRPIVIPTGSHALRLPCPLIQMENPLTVWNSAARWHSSARQAAQGPTSHVVPQVARLTRLPKQSHVTAIKVIF